MNDFLQQYGLTRSKLAVIACLVAVMVGVWSNALMGSGSQSVSKRSPKPRPAANAPAVVDSAGDASTPGDDTTAPVLSPKRSVPVAEIPRVIQHDPFSRPRWAIEPGAVSRRGVRTSLSEREALLADLREQGVTMVMLSGELPVATIGDHQVKRGDTLSGFRVLDITAEGIVLSQQPISDER